MAKEMIDQIDLWAAENLSEREIILNFVKKYGTNTFADKNEERRFRQELIENVPLERPIISLTPESLDLGNVSQ
ncbi:MAG: hypothetical protein ACPLZH_02680, partial [Minisyncoccales bacterium]